MQPAFFRLFLLVVLLLQIFFAADANAHGGVVEEDDLCVINIGYLRAHFKIYVPDARQHEEFCEDIPVNGNSVFIMEYQHDVLNSAEIDFRIVHNTTGKGNFARLEDLDAIDDLDAITVRYEKPGVVPDVFMLQQEFPDGGEYIGIVSARQADTQKLYTAVFPFEVGYTGIGYWPWILGGLLLLQLNYWFMSRRRAQKTTNVLFVLLALLGTSPDVTAADEPGWQSRAGHFDLSYSSELQPLAINKIHDWVLHVVDSDGNPVEGAELEIGGGMPKHDHGLPTAPEITELGNGNYRVSGMRFHMNGYWELKIEIRTATERDTVLIKLTL
jgi:hypothetical protein